jgi:hypothetical protein
MLGNAAVAMWWNIAPEMRTEWEDWHTHEHMPERLGIPGFLRGSRWISGESYFVLYEVEGMGTLTAGAYLDRLNAPTPWSRKLMPHHRNMVRSLCHVRASFGRGLGGCIATLRLEDGLPVQALSALPQRGGLVGAFLLEAQSMAGAPQTTEQQIRGGSDAEARWVGLIAGYDEGAVLRAATALVGHGVLGVYRLSYTL